MGNDTSIPIDITPSTIEYTNCHNEAGWPENKNCSMSVLIATSIDHHREYLGIPISMMCTDYEPPFIKITANMQTLIEEEEE